MFIILGCFTVLKIFYYWNAEGLFFSKGIEALVIPIGCGKRFSIDAMERLKEFDSEIDIYFTTGESRPEVIKLFTVLNSAEHKIYPAYKC